MPQANHPVSGFPRSLWQSIPGSQVSALGSQVRVIRYRFGYGEIQVLNLYPNLRTCTWYLTAETRDLRVYAPSQSSGLRFPLE